MVGNWYWGSVLALLLLCMGKEVASPSFTSTSWVPGATSQCTKTGLYPHLPLWYILDQQGVNLNGEAQGSGEQATGLHGPFCGPFPPIDAFTGGLPKWPRACWLPTLPG